MILKYLILFLVCQLLIASSRSLELDEAVQILKTPTKSDFDKNEYRLIRIKENGLKILLISNKLSNNDNSHVALTVGVGSSSDILVGVPGMAHFLEHMLFMGTEKYPEENSFDKFMSMHGDNLNARTEFQYTSYKYSVNKDALDESLDRFSQFFISPLLRKESMTREREAVESEFQSAQEATYIQYEAMLAELANKSHPLSYFSWGNLKSLRDDISDEDLNNKMRQFFESFYQPNKMYLSIQSSQDLDELQEVAVKYFSKIPSSKSGAETIPESTFDWENAVTEDLYNKITYMKTTSNTETKIVLTWILPSYSKEYKYNVIEYLTLLFESDGAGSLSKYLRDQKLATKVKAKDDFYPSSFEHNSIFTIFHVFVTLTDYGYENLDCVLDAIYSYLLFLQEFAPSHDFYEDMKNIKETEFRFKSDSETHASDLSNNMYFYEPEDIITGSQLFYEYNEELLKSVIDRLNTGKMNLMILNPDLETNKVEKWMGIEYRLEDYPEQFKKIWENRRVKEEFSYPKKNNFISTDFQIVYNSGMINNSEYPVKISENPCVEVWYRLDDKFLLPIVVVKVFFEAPAGHHNVTLLHLYEKLLNQLLTEDLNAFKQANYDVQLILIPKGLDLSISGFNEKVELVLEVILNKMIKLHDIIQESDREMFEKHQEIRSTCQAISGRANYMNREIFKKVVDIDSSGCLEIFEEVEDIKSENLKEFSKNFLQSMRVKMLVQGNIKKSEVDRLGRMINMNSKCNKEEFKPSNVRKLPNKKTILNVKLKSRQSSSMIMNYYQFGPASIEREAKLELFQNLLSEPLFNILRTQHQLGYEVWEDLQIIHHILGLSINVISQEDKNSHVSVYEKIEDFLHVGFSKILEEMTEDFFESLKNSLVQEKRLEPLKLIEEVAGNWKVIKENKYKFDRSKQVGNAMEKLSISDIREFYKNEIQSSNLRQLSVQTIGNISKDLEQDQLEVEDKENLVDQVGLKKVEDFISTLPIYDNVDSI